MKRLLAGCAVLLISIGLMTGAGMRKFRAYREDVPAEEIVFYDKVLEPSLVEDSTFAGVRRSEITGRLISTYDRTQPKGRRACPT